MKLTSRKKVEILRPVVYVEFSSVLYAVITIMRIYALGLRVLRVTLLCGDKPAGKLKYLVIPSVQLIRR